MLREQIHSITQAGRDEIVNLLKLLIDVPSVTGEEGAVQQVVAQLLRDTGMEVDQWEPGPELERHPAYVPTGESFAGRPCVVGKWRGSGGGRSLLINGHVDVVAPEPLENWDSDPFCARIEDGRVIGRGAADMKGGLAAAIAAVQVLRRAGFVPWGDLLIQSVPAEENGGNGTVAAAARGYTADAGIFPEPTGCRIQPAHRGAAFWRIHIDGVATHGGTKYKGVSAVEKGMLVAQALQELEVRRNKDICSKHPLYGGYPVSAPVTLGIFRGGQFTSAQPEYCMLEGCIEFVPGEESGEVVAQFERAVAQAAEKDVFLKLHRPRVEWFGLLYNPAETPVAHPFVQEMMSCYQVVTGRQPVVNGFEAGTDMRTLRNHYGVPGVMFGPGELGMAHAPNESVDIDQLLLAVEVMATAIARWCGGGQ